MNDVRVTYYLGAGASANAVPMVSQIRRFYKPFLEFVESKIGTIGWGDNTHAVEGTREQFKSITEELENHHTPDTFAKKLWLTKKIKQSKQLKIYLSLFFYWIENKYTPSINEVVKGGIDERYDPFFATLLERAPFDKLKLPHNINIITWNYDNQLEIAYSRFLERISDQTIRDGLGILPRVYHQEYSPEISKVIKLNGCSRLYYVDERKEVQNPFKHPTDDEIPMDLIKEFASTLESGKRNFDGPLINFAWEADNPASKEAIEETENIFSKTQILVIIGYSFPTFNRSVDRALFKCLPDGCTVYYQAPEPVVRDLIDKLNPMCPWKNTVKPVINLDQFHIPIEL